MGLTKEQAIALSDSEFWKDMTPAERFEFQIAEPRLCIPFDKFHEGAEVALGRPVWTHEFADSDALKAEFYGERKRPTLDEIIGQLPAEKTIIVVIEEARE